MQVLSGATDLNTVFRNVTGGMNLICDIHKLHAEIYQTGVIFFTLVMRWVRVRVAS